MVLLAFICGCASAPLRTPIREPSRSCEAPDGTRIGFFGFEDPDLPGFAARAEQLLRDSGFTVRQHSADRFWEPRSPSADLDMAFLLQDAFQDVHANATARWFTNLYFTITVIDIWILPILHATELFESSARVGGEFRGHDFRSDARPRLDSLQSSIEEKPTGYFGPRNDEFGRLLVERASLNLAAVFYDELCSVYAGGARATREP